jgi:hypothetical protein
MANKVWSLTISALGSSTGPFKITDNFGNIVANNVTKPSLLGGTTVTVVSNASSLTVTDLSACGLSKTIALGTGFVATRSGSFTRNNCGAGFNGSTVVFNNTYTSMVSQAQAEALADANFNADGQAYANANGVCTPEFVNCSWYSIANNNNFEINVSYKLCNSNSLTYVNVGANSVDLTPCIVDNSINVNNSNVQIVQQASCS